MKLPESDRIFFLKVLVLGIVLAMGNIRPDKINLQLSQTSIGKLVLNGSNWQKKEEKFIYKKIFLLKVQD